MALASYAGAGRALKAPYHDSAQLDLDKLGWLVGGGWGTECSSSFSEKTR